MKIDEHVSEEQNLNWHALTADRVLDELDTNRSGLSEEERQARRHRYGPNELPRRKEAGLVKIVLRQFIDPLIFILLAAAAVSLATGYYNNAVFISLVLLVNTTLGAWQEFKAEKNASALQETIQIKARIRIDGEVREHNASDLVPGDVIEVSGGLSVPADARLFDSDELQVDESLLTGESTPVAKDAETEIAEDAPLGDRTTMLHGGSMVMTGRGVAVICRTGEKTEIGRIAASLASGRRQEPPLVIRLRRFSRLIGIATLGAIAILAVIQALRGDSLHDIFFLGVALAVSAIPAGLPVAITVALSIASKRMADRKVVVRMLPAVEGLGACTCIASDKTGTLTANQLTVQCVQLADGSEVEVTGTGVTTAGDLRCGNDECPAEQRQDVARLARAAVYCNEGELNEKTDGEEIETHGDTVDIAFLVLGRKLALDQKSLRDQAERLGVLPFASERRYAATFERIDNKVIAHVKGAAAAVAQMCGMDEAAIADREEELAARGYRVLAVAAGEVEENAARAKDRSALQNLEFLGLAGLIDPIREEVPEAVARCHEAGITVRMVTGDHPATGLAIARQIGIAGDDDTALTGQELAECEPEKVAERVAGVKVYARVEPTQKTTIVSALQARGDFVAVTGDGVNDAPALKEAHIGVAMGKGGTDVARNNADLILTDDNFASIVNGIEEGRIAYSNVRKVVWLLISTGAAEVLLFFLAIGFGYPIPLLPVQLLWLNLVTNGIQDVALAFERGSPELLRQPPRSPQEPIFNARMIQQVAASGFYIGVVAFAGFHYWHGVIGLSIEASRNLTLFLVVLFENVHIFSCRSEYRSAFRIPLSANPLLIGAVVLAQGVHIAALFTPWLSDVLQVTPIRLTDWGIMLLIALSLLLFDEAVKWLHRRFAESR